VGGPDGRVRVAPLRDTRRRRGLAEHLGSFACGLYSEPGEGDDPPISLQRSCPRLQQTSSDRYPDQDENGAADEFAPSTESVPKSTADFQAEQ